MEYDEPSTLDDQRRALLRAYYRKRRRESETKLAWRRIFALQNTPTSHNS